MGDLWGGGWLRSWIIGFYKPPGSLWACARSLLPADPPPQRLPTHSCTVLVRPLPQPLPAVRLLALVCALPAAWAQPLPSAWDVPLPPLQLQSSQRLQEDIPASARGQQPVYLAADRFEGQTDLRAKLQGQVELRRGDTVIRAEQAEYTVANDTVTAQGNVHINRGGNIYQGTQLQLQVDAFQGDFTEATYQFLDTQGHGDAQRVQFFSRERSTIHEATYTTCQRDDSTSWAPDWVLQAERMELDRATDTGVAYDAVLKFKGVPILPVPVVSFPLSDRRKSGLLPPTIGIDSVSGVEYAQPYYWNIAPNRDATITPTVMSKRGVMLGTEFRYLERDYHGDLNLSYMPNDRLRDRDRWSYAWRNRANLSNWLPGLNADVKLHRVSDNNYWRDFSLLNSTGLKEDRLLESYGTLTWGRDGHQLLARAQQWQTLQDVDAPIAPPFNRLPQLQWRYSPQELRNAWGLDGHMEADTTRFRASTIDGREHVDNGQRSYWVAQVSRPFLSPGSFVTPKLKLHTANYRMDNELLGRSRNRSLALPTFSLDSGLIFERPTQVRGRNYVQTLEPRAFYTYTPYRDQAMLPLYDTALSDFNLASIYSENSYTGHDRVADNNMVTLGLTTRYLQADTGAEVARLGIAQRLRLSDQRTTLGYDAPGMKGWSDILVGAGFTWGRRWSADGLVQYNRDIQRTTRTTVSGRYHPGPFQVVSAAYRLQRENTSPIANQGSEQVELGWQWPLTQSAQGRWYSVGRLNYSMYDKKMVDTIVGVEFDGCCWVGRVVLERLQNSISRSNTRLLFQLELVGFSRLSLGANPLASLNEYVPGYQPLHSQPSTAPSRFSNYD